MLMLNCCAILGHYCPQGTSNMLPCPKGTYRSLSLGRSQADCVTCTPGKFCNDSGLTEPGMCKIWYTGYHGVLVLGSLFF